MSYRLRVENSGNRLALNLEFWEKFMDESGFLHKHDYDIDYYLKPYRAKNVKDEPFIEFESEADATWFVLRWS